MAHRMQIVDDIDGTDAVETVSFSIDGATYEIDLNQMHADQIRETFSIWIANARRLRGRRANTKSSAPRNSASCSTEVREWAQANGYQVNPRGRIANEIVEAYEKAHAK